MKKERKRYWISDLITDKSGEPSSIRLILIMLSILCCMLLYSVYYYINSWIVLGKDPNWIGLASFVGAMATLIGAVVYGKVKQKGAETDLPFQNTIPQNNVYVPPQQEDSKYEGFTEGK